MGEFSVRKESGNFKLNRRETKRIIFLKKIKFGIGEAVFPGTSYNISRNGMLVHSLKSFLPDSKLNIKIISDVEVYNLIADVKWVTRTHNHTGSFMGLHFMDNNFELGKLYMKELNSNRHSDLQH